MKCNMPPIGWECSRNQGHDGPCAAYPTMMSSDGKSWIPAKRVPYYPTLIEEIKCAFGFHQLEVSKSWLDTKYCLLCGKRRV